MPDHSSDAEEPRSDTGLRAADAMMPPAVDAPAVDPLAIPAPDANPTADEPQLRRAHVPRDDWRLGGRSVRRWREWLLAGALLSLGAGILVGTLIASVWDSPWVAASATVLVWIGMLAPTVWALSRSRPRGLLRFRAVDLLYGLVLGGLLRLTQGWMEVAAGGTGALPSFGLIDGRLPAEVWVVDGFGGVVVAPLIEEFFFHGVILIALYTVLRRPFGKPAAAIVAIVASGGLFVLVHSMLLSLPVDQVFALALLALICGLLVVLTGRIWGAVFVHLTFNASFLLLALVGTYLA